MNSIHKITEHKNTYIVFLYRFFCLCLIFSILSGSIKVYAEQSSGGFRYYVYFDKEYIDYNGVSPDYIFGSSVLDTTEQPSIITANGVALCSADVIFANGLGVSCNYNSSNRKITISNNSTKIVMYVDDKTAYVNNEPIAMNAAPKRIKYKSSGIKASLVPSRFVAETLGYKYNWNETAGTVTITEPLKLAFDGVDQIYTGTQGKVTYNDVIVDVSGSPSIIIQDNALLRANKVFSKAMGIEYSYVKSSGNVSFSIGELKLDMTLDRLDCYLNGRYLEAPIAPRIIYNYSTATKYVYVPGRFVAETLGYSYTWDYSTGTSKIKYTDKVGIAPIEEELIYVSDPGDSGQGSIDSSIKPAQYFTWNAPPPYELLSSIVSDGEINDYSNGETSYINYAYGVVSNSEQNALYDTYTVTFSEKLQNYSCYIFNNSLIIDMKSCIGNEVTNYINSSLVNYVKLQSDFSAYTNQILFDLKYENLSCKTNISLDGRVLTIRIYRNYLIAVNSGINERGEFIRFTGTAPISPAIDKKDDYYVINMPDVVNSMGANYYQTKGEYLLNNMNLYDDGLCTTSMVIEGVADMQCEYNIETDGNSCTVYFSKEITDTSCLQYLSIPIPSDITIDSITDEDCYYDNKILFTFPGDYREYYSSCNIANTGEAVKQLQVNYLSNNTTQISILTEDICGYSYKLSSGKLSVKLDRPGKIYKKIVVLDAGHGGGAPGTVHGGYNEKDVNFSIVWDYCRPMFAKTDIKVYFTRHDDTDIALADRAAFAAKVDADLFVSVHHNSNNNTSIMGTSVYYSTINYIETPSGMTSKKLAAMFLNSLTTSLGTINRGIIDKGFVVVRDNSVPSVLLEVGFMSNPFELALVVSDSFKEKAAQSICDTIAEAFTQYPTGR